VPRGHNQTNLGRITKCQPGSNFISEIPASPNGIWAGPGVSALGSILLTGKYVLGNLKRWNSSPRFLKRCNKLALWNTFQSYGRHKILCRGQPINTSAGQTSTNRLPMLSRHVDLTKNGQKKWKPPKTPKCLWVYLVNRGRWHNKSWACSTWYTLIQLSASLDEVFLASGEGHPQSTFENFFKSRLLTIDFCNF